MIENILMVLGGLIIYILGILSGIGIAYLLATLLEREM